MTLQQCRRALVMETIALVYGDGDPEKQGRLLAQCRRLKQRAKNRRNKMWKRLEVPVPAHKRPALSLSTSGRLSWTPAVMGLADATHVAVYYDDETHQLGVCLASETNGLQVRSGGYVAVRELLRAAGVWEQIEGQLPIRHAPAKAIQLGPPVADDDPDDGRIWAIQLGQPA